MNSSSAGPSPVRDSAVKSLRHREKSPQPAVGLSDVRLDARKIDHVSFPLFPEERQQRLRPETIKEIDLLVAQYLASRSSATARVFEEEVFGRKRDEERKEEIEEVERALLEGDYSSLEGLVARPGLLRAQPQKAFLYMCYRQQFLEHIENRESQKAFNLLAKRLKPLEHYQPYPYDFYALSYLTSANTVQDAPAFRDWGGVGIERENLVGMWKELTENVGRAEGYETPSVAQDRLKVLLRQAAAWQIQRARRTGPGPWNVSSLLEDYRPLVTPQNLLRLVHGHRANVKCVCFIDEEGSMAVSGSSDSTLRILSTEDGTTQQVLAGHSSRVWDCSCANGHIASASGDGTVRIWSGMDSTCRGVLSGGSGDVYGVRWRPDRQAQLVSASYDRILRSWDVEKEKQIRTFSGHAQSIFSVDYHPSGNILASGSKDKHIRLWDAVGGVCIQTTAPALGEITSVEFDREGRYLLAGCKDNSNGLWDLRMASPMRSSHQNTSKNLIRSSFASSSSGLIVSASEDGLIYIWEREGSNEEPAASSVLQPNGEPLPKLSAPGLLPPPIFDSASQATSFSHPSYLDRSTSLSVPLPAAPHQLPQARSPDTNRSSPAYYPPRDSKAVTKNSGIRTIRPVKVLEGHGEGAVYDVKWRGDRMISAGEDGCVGIWGVDEARE